VSRYAPSMRTEWSGVRQVGLVRLLFAVVVPLALVVVCASQDRSYTTRWVTSLAGAEAAAPGSSASPGPSSSASSSTSGTSAGNAPVSNSFTTRIPKFPPPPEPEPITLPAGPAAAWLSRIPTTQPVAFLTIDDGWTKVPGAVPLIQAAHIPVTLFLTINAVRDNPAYFAPQQKAGAVIEAHTITHTNLRGQSYDYQKREICGSADQLGGLFGRRPTLFRPPFGEKDDNTLRAAHDCGMKACFFWRETINTGTVRFQEGNRIQRGDIILMHYRAEFVADFLAALQAVADAGLTPALLENYIPGAGAPTPPL
jgi:peptidoglycan/xylan/chitin deacetylase (PgdA/CDA1 family)